jgi:dipeptidyl-peptidase III
LYDEITHVDEWWGGKARPMVLDKKTPRKIFVQANTVLQDDGKVSLKEYEPTLEGMVQSYVERNV